MSIFTRTTEQPVAAAGLGSAAANIPGVTAEKATPLISSAQHSFFGLIALFVIWFIPLPVLAEINSIKIASILDPNAIIITEVDVVFVYDQQIADSLAATKSDWYSGKFMFSRRVGDKVDIVNTFVPQGFDSVTLNLPSRHATALRTVVFAHHDDGESRAIDILEMEDVLIEVDPFGIRVTEQ